MKSPRRVVYTCVTNGYDRVIPPADPVPNVDYILFTDRPEIDQVNGWITRSIETPEGLSPSLRNRYYKLLPHKVLAEYDESLYLDSNISVIGSLAPFFDEVFNHPENMMIYRHPVRDTVASEADMITRTGRTKAPQKVAGEVARYREDGFPDDQQLTSNAILMRRHTAADVVAAMELWWDLLGEGSGRDQLSLPYVRWKLEFAVHVLEPDFTFGSPYFLRYPHWETSGRRGRALVLAAQRRQDSLLWRLLHELITRSYGRGSPNF